MSHRQVQDKLNTVADIKSQRACARQWVEEQINCSVGARRRQRTGEVQVAHHGERPTPLCSGLGAIELASPMLHAYSGTKTCKYRREAVAVTSTAVRHSAGTAIAPAPTLGTFCAAFTKLLMVNGARNLCANRGGRTRRLFAPVCSSGSIACALVSNRVCAAKVHRTAGGRPKTLQARR